MSKTYKTGETVELFDQVTINVPCADGQSTRLVPGMVTQLATGGAMIRVGYQIEVGLGQEPHAASILVGIKHLSFVARDPAEEDA